MCAMISLNALAIICRGWKTFAELNEGVNEVVILLQIRLGAKGRIIVFCLRGEKDSVAGI